MTRDDDFLRGRAALHARLAGLTLLDRHRAEGRLARARRPEDLEGIERLVVAGEARADVRRSAVPVCTYPDELPVSARRADIMAAIAAHQVVVVAGETGSGKTTQIPKMCLELGRGVAGMIGHTQPRRIAARTVAERLAEELRVPLGQAVGYAVRFDDRVAPATLVKVMTDGILLAEIRRDRQLRAYNTIIVDEAHERSLNIDFLLGYLTQLLPARPELKVVVTSATIDTDRFAAHFSAPVVEVSGRTYPVEVRYRPLDDDDDGAEVDEEAGVDDLPGRGSPRPPAGPGGPAARAPEARDQAQGICDAVRELEAEGPGDILVFLAGERDIRDAADALREQLADRQDVEILPLYARLSAAEQHKVFRPHRGRRVVLATNVAETSLTVPGVRYVIDTGKARLSRYNHRTKVQRLPIEPVSQASANQRAGRCGRVGPGVCIRLYAESDFVARPEFTDPEILRTNLASVILQMAAAGLGDVAAFPFIEPPDRRSISGGMALLEELGAFAADPGAGGGGLRLSPVGRKLADIPLDPRLGRMVIEAERLDCVREVTIVAAALSIQDPRERPADQQQAAEQAHARFKVADSDFLGILALWEHLSAQQSALSGNQFRKYCRAHFLNVLRIREWQDLVGQIRQVHRSGGVRPNREPAPPDHIHQALLAGLLSHIGMRDRVRGDYQGARTTRWQIGRGSVVARKQPAWVMAAEIVETERAWARTVARIEPAWAERLGAHLVKRTYAEPWWDPDRGEAVSEERISLFGLPIVANRRCSYARIDPVAARGIFIEHGLVQGDWAAVPDFVTRTSQRMAEITALEDRVRRRDLLAPDAARATFWDERIPARIASGAAFTKWWRRAQRDQPDLLDVPLDVLVDRSGGPVDLRQWPDEWHQGQLRLPLRYTYDPGKPDDGVVARIPLGVLNRVVATGFDWNVAGLRPELVTALVRSLPKGIRRAVGPAADVAAAVLGDAGPSDGPLLDVVARRLSVLAGEPVSPDVWRMDELAPHLRMRFEVVGAEGAVLARGTDLPALQRMMAPEIRAAIAAAAPPGLRRRRATAWDWDDLPRRVDVGDLVGYPALLDEGSSVAVALLDSEAAQSHHMWAGTRRLVRLQVGLNAGHLQRRLSNDTKLAFARSSEPLADLLDDCIVAALDEVIAKCGGPTYTKVGFDALVGEARRVLEGRVVDLATVAGGVLAAADRVRRRADVLADGDRSGALTGSLADVHRQIDGLLPPGFVTTLGVAHLGDTLRYLDAAERRLARLPGDVTRDRRRMAEVRAVQSRYEALADQVVDGTAPAAVLAGLARVRWMIEELRVSLWAETLGTAGSVSVARITRLLDAMTGR